MKYPEENLYPVKEHIDWLDGGCKGECPFIHIDAWLKRPEIYMPDYRVRIAHGELWVRARDYYLRLAGDEMGLDTGLEELYMADAANFLRLAWFIQQGRFKEAFNCAHRMDTDPRENVPGSLWWLLEAEGLFNTDRVEDRLIKDKAHILAIPASSEYEGSEHE